MASEEPLVDVWATDVSVDALAVARANTVGIGRAGARVRLVQGDWFDALPDDLAGTLAVIVANPPYVAAADPLPPEVVDWEPAAALVAGPTGREALDHLVDHAGPWLRPGGALVLELAPGQAAPLAQRARQAGYQDVDVHDDLAGRPRVLVARAPGGPPAAATATAEAASYREIDG